MYVANFATMCTVRCDLVCVCAGDSATTLLSLDPRLPRTQKRSSLLTSCPTKPFASSISSIGEKLVLAARYNWWRQPYILYPHVVYIYEYWPVVITAVRAHYTRHLEPLTYSPWLLLTFDPLGICYATDFQRIFCKSTKFRGTASDSTYALIAGPERGRAMCVCLRLSRASIWRLQLCRSSIHLGLPSFRFPASALSEPFPKSAIVALTVK